jgi:hypothetical protein
MSIYNLAISFNSHKTVRKFIFKTVLCKGGCPAFQIVYGQPDNIEITIYLYEYLFNIFYDKGNTGPPLAQRDAHRYLPPGVSVH